MGSATDFTGGLPETFCGRGSTLRRTKKIRKQLPGIFHRFGIRTLLDVPCGDCNWISRMDLPVKYYGIDLSERNVNAALEREWKNPSWKRRIIQGNCLTAHWPKVDAILSRDFFQHLSIDDIHAMLVRIKTSGAKYLFGTCYTKDINREIDEKMYRPVNIEIEPFNFGKPMMKIEEQSEHLYLGVYKLK